MENVATFLLTLSNRSNQLVGQNTGTFIEETATSLFKPKYVELLIPKASQETLQSQDCC